MLKKVFLVSCAMDCFALLALIADDEPAGGARKRKRSSTSRATGFAQRNRSSTSQATGFAQRNRARSSTSQPTGFAQRNRASTRHGTVSAPSDSMSIADLLRLVPSRGRQPLKKRKLTGARDRTTGAAQQQIVQVQRFNKPGRATRHDALMQTGGNVCKVRGESTWRRWTPEAIQRAGFSRGSVRTFAEDMKDTKNPTASGKTSHAIVTFFKTGGCKDDCGWDCEGAASHS